MRVLLKRTLSVRVIVFSMMFVFAAATTHAESPFSQLDFDDAMSPPASKKEAPKAEVVDPEVILQMEEVVIDPQASATSVKTVTDFKLKTAASFIVPRLKGPLVDEGSPETITSTESWTRRASATCGFPNNATEKCKKIRALREVLKRYTGTDDFFMTQCAGDCPKDYSSLPTGITVERNSKADFDFSGSGRSCNYQFSLRPKGEWRAFETTAVTCECVRNECLK